MPFYAHSNIITINTMKKNENGMWNMMESNTFLLHEWDARPVGGERMMTFSLPISQSATVQDRN
jgi:hypothetical protein